MDNFLEIRDAFVAMIKKENSQVDRWQRQSLKQHWSGPRGGFADERVNGRWNDFYSGWVTAFPIGYEAGCKATKTEVSK